MAAWVLPVAMAAMGAVSNYMGQKSANKAAKEAAKPKPYESFRTPYMNEYMSLYAPWLMAMQQKIFESRLKQYGLDPAQFGLGSLAASFASIPTSYSGVGKPGSPVLGAGSYNPGAVNPFAANFGGQAYQVPQKVLDRAAVNRAGGGGGLIGELRGSALRGGSY